MKYIYDEYQTRTSEPVVAFLRIMGKLDQIQKTIDICNSIDDDELRNQLEGKQCRIIQQMTQMMQALYNIKPKYSITELTSDMDLIEYRNQKQITSIEEQVKDYWKNQ